MADNHNIDIAPQKQCLLDQIDATQMVLNVVEHLPMFTEQILSDLKRDCSTEQIDRQLTCLHKELLALSEKALETNFVRVSSLLCKKNSK